MECAVTSTGYRVYLVYNIKGIGLQSVVYSL